jgi:hypothetical protein
MSILNKFITQLKGVLKPVKKLKAHLALRSLLMELLYKIRLKPPSITHKLGKTQMSRTFLGPKEGLILEKRPWFSI